MIALAATFALTLIQSAGSGRIEGTVLKSGSFEPMSGVAVTLMRKVNPEQGRASLILAHDGVSVLEFSANPIVKPAVTDAGGRFSIENVPAGGWAVIARAEGYFGRGSDPESPATFDGAALSDMVIVTVEPGKAATAAMELIPAAVISGRVTDPQGAPLVGQDVRAFRAHRQGEKVVFRQVTLAATDDRGRYRLHTLPPGDYVVASSRGFPEREPTPESVVRARPVPGTEVPVMTFHPSTVAPDTASSIAIRGGEDLDNRDIRVRHASVVSISGEVLDDSGLQGVSVASVQLVPLGGKWALDYGGVLGSEVDPNGVLEATSATLENKRGRFEFRGAFRAGSYEVRATAGGQGGRLAVGRTLINVDSRDVGEITIPIGKVK